MGRRRTRQTSRTTSESPSPAQDSSQDNSSATTARPRTGASRWLPWQDRFLAQEVYKLRPFSAGKGKEGEAWDNLAEDLRKDSERQGQKSLISRTGMACRARMKKLLDVHRKEETTSLQKTGTNEEIDEHIKIMTEILQLINDQEEETLTKSKNAKAKKDAEKKGGEELRDASMRGLVTRNKLSDITQLENSTLRERQAQKSGKHAREESTSGVEDEKENMMPPSKKRHTNTSSAVESMLSQRIKHDEKCLEDARLREEQRHQEVVAGQNQIIEGLQAVAKGLDSVVKDRAEERREVQKHQLDVIAMFRDRQL